MNVLLRLGRLATRTLRGLAPRLARPDDGFAEAHLRGPELVAYRSMDARDRDHACRVARRLTAVLDEADSVPLRAAFLHDLGKSDGPYHLWERVLVHLWTPDEALAERYPAALAAAWRRHRDHPTIGAARLRSLGVDERVADLVARHHLPPGDDVALARLVRADQDA